MTALSRRQFLGVSAGSLAATLLSTEPLSASIVRAQLAAASTSASMQRLSIGWEYFQGSLAGAWHVWHGDEIAAWQPTTMPHCVNAHDGCDPDQPCYHGQAWYRTYLQPHNPYDGGRTLLHFEGAGQATTVYIGDRIIGHHLGGYDEFIYDITEVIATPNIAVKDKGIPLAVLCDNSRTLDTIPSDLSDFSLYGGLYRHVNLVYVPAVSIEAVHIHVTNVSSDHADISLRARLYNPDKFASPLQFTIDVLDPAGKTIHHSTRPLPAWQDEIELLQLPLTTPMLWSPSTPHLYECRITLRSGQIDRETRDRFGVRHYEFVEHGPFMLNGQRLLLRGTHRHEDHADYAAAQPDDLIRKEMQMIRDMGANFIRLAHYQQSRLVLNLCDELGLLVWEEIPWCRCGVGNDAFKDMVRDKLRRMVDQHFNHPSIILWGLGNEDDWPTEYPSVNRPQIRALMQEIRDLAHQLDPTRLTSFRRCEFARDIPDVYSPSIWAGWYSGTYPEYQHSLEVSRDQVKRMIHIEWGADSHAGRHSEDPDGVVKQIQTGQGTAESGLAYLPVGGPARASKDGDWSETYACNLFDWHLKTQEALPWLTGSAQWIFKDFTTPLRPENPVPRVNQKGVVERDLTPKESYYLFQSYWTEELMAHIYAHSWPIRWGDAGEKKLVKVYSNCETAELFLNGASVGTKKRNSQDFPAAGLRWLVAFKPGQNYLRVVAKKAGKTVTDELGFIYQTKKWNRPTTLKLIELHRSNGIVTVEARLYDAQQVQCLDARNRIRFTLAGNGTLIDNMGTPKASRVVELANGRSEISLKLNGAGSHIAAIVDGINSAFLEVRA